MYTRFVKRQSFVWDARESEGSLVRDEETINGLAHSSNEDPYSVPRASDALCLASSAELQRMAHVLHAASETAPVRRAPGAGGSRLRAERADE